MTLTTEIKDAERDIDRLQGEVRDAGRAVASAQAKFAGKSIVGLDDTDPDVIALSEAGKKYDGLKDDLIKAVGNVRLFDRGAEEVLDRKGIASPDKGEVKGWNQTVNELVETEEFKSAMHRYAGGRSAGAIGQVELGDLVDRDNVKALVTRGQGGIDSLVTPDRRSLVDASPYEELTLLDLLTIGQTDSNAIEYPAFLGRSGAAAIIPDPTSSATSSATTKPDIGLAFELRSARVRTLAAGIPVYRNTLEDNTAYLRSVIREQLFKALKFKLQEQTIAGDGTGENFTGVLNTSGIVPIVSGDAGHASESNADALHRAITALRLTGDNATAVVMHPADFEALRLMKDGTDNYYYGPPSIAGPLTVWGKRVIDTIAIPQGTALLADWSTVQLLIRKAIVLLSSDSHADFFMKNLIQFLAEMRAALLVTRPGAVVKVTGL